jgi:hypothetical protein
VECPARTVALGGVTGSQVEFSGYFAHRELGANSIDDVVEYCLGGMQVARPAGREQGRSFAILVASRCRSPEAAVLVVGACTSE